MHPVTKFQSSCFHVNTILLGKKFTTEALEQQRCCITFVQSVSLKEYHKDCHIIHIIHYFYWGSLLTRKVDRVYKYTVPYGVLQSVYTCCTGRGTDLWRLDTCSVTHGWVILNGVNKSFSQNTRLHFQDLHFCMKILVIMKGKLNWARGTL